MYEIKRNWGLIVVGAFMLVTVCYILVSGENIYLQTHDFLDSDPAVMKMLSDKNLFWEKDAEVPLLGGLNRNYVYSDLKAYTWLFMILPTFPAIIVGWYLKIIFSMIGFFLLAKEIYGNAVQKNIIILCGFLYGIIPSYPPAAFGFATIPVLLYLMIKLYKRFDWKYIIGLLVYPIFTDFVFFGIFICGYILAFFVIDWIANRRSRLRVVGGLTAISVGLIITDWRLFYMILFSGEENIRKTFVYNDVNMSTALVDSIKVGINGYYHCGSLHKYIVLPVCVAAFLYINFMYIKRRQMKEIVTDKINWVMCLIVCNCMIYGLSEIGEVMEVISKFIPSLEGFSFSRIIWFNPFLWYLAFMLVLCRMKKVWLKYILILAAFCVLCLRPEMYNHIYANLRPIGYKIIRNQDYDGFTYAEFYSAKLFEKVKKELGYDGEWSVAFGMHPSVLEYNGISTLDGYASCYALDYKRQFRKLMKPEFDRNEDAANYFDDWGARAYVSSDGIGAYLGRKLDKEEANLFIDANAFEQMGGKYVFSRVAILNADELGLRLNGIFSDDSSPYEIYAYEMNYE